MVTTNGPTRAWTPLRPHPEQYKLWTCPRRFVAVVAGRGSGKTELAKRRLVRYLPVQKPWHDPMYFYAGPTRLQTKRIAWRHFKELIPSTWIADISETELFIRTIFGSWLYVLGMDQPQRIEGPQWDGGIIDESSDIKPGAFGRSVFPALTHRAGWCWRIGVPKRRGIGAMEFRRFHAEGLSGRHVDRASFTWPSSTVLPPEVVADAQRTLDAKDFREQFEATWETSGGSIFHAFDRSVNVRPCPYQSDLPLFVGCDFNVNPMAWVFGHVYDNRVEWVDELWLRDTNTSQAINVLCRRYGAHRGGLVFIGDATSKRRHTSATASDYLQLANHPQLKMLRAKISFPKSNPAVEDRFASCNAMFCNALGESRMFVSPSCVHLIEDLESRYYKEGTREAADSGDLGHITDAMGYPVHKLFPIKLESAGRAGVVAREGVNPWQYQ